MSGAEGSIFLELVLVQGTPPTYPESPASPLVPPSSCSPTFLPSLPLLPPLLKPGSSLDLSPLVPVSPSAHPQPAPSGHYDPPRDFQSPAPPRHDDPLSPPPVSESWTPPQPFDSSRLIEAHRLGS